MARRCICRTCGKHLTTDVAFKVVKNGKNVYFCNEFESWEWEEEQKKIESDTFIWNQLYVFIKVEILKYNEVQKLPKYLIERLQDLRSGTVFEKGKGRVKKHRDGYPYEVILQTFKDMVKDINYYFNTKIFQNERQKINYMMAIVEGNINNTYSKWVEYNKPKIEHTELKTDNDVEILHIDVDISNNNKSTKDLNGFFADWE